MKLQTIKDMILTVGSLEKNEYQLQAFIELKHLLNGTSATLHMFNEKREIEYKKLLALFDKQLEKNNTSLEFEFIPNTYFEFEGGF